MAGRAATRARLGVPPGLSLRQFRAREADPVSELLGVLRAGGFHAVELVPARRPRRQAAPKRRKTASTPARRKHAPGVEKRIGKKKYHSYFDAKVEELKNRAQPPANPWAVAHVITRRHFNKQRRQARKG